MSNTHNTQQQEQILVIRRNVLFMYPEEYFEGIKNARDCKEILSRISGYAHFKPRNEMEQDELFMQIIPYIILRHKNTFFLYKRLQKAQESRLHEKYSLGIGGHINPQDESQDTLTTAALREIQEELHLPQQGKLKLLGFLNRNREPVDKVHLGAVFLLDLPSSELSVKESGKLQAIGFLPIAEIQRHYEKLEGWSQMVLDYLKSLKGVR